MEELFALPMCWGIRVERELRVSARYILLFSPLIPGWSPVGARPPGDGCQHQVQLSSRSSRLKVGKQTLTPHYSHGSSAASYKTQLSIIYLLSHSLNQDRTRYLNKHIFIQHMKEEKSS